MQFSNKIIEITKEAEIALADIFKEIDEISFRNTKKIMNAFSEHRVSDAMFGATSGYGYDDKGREVLDEIWADVMDAESALVRHSIVSGTHALTIGLFGLLRTGDIMLSVADKPYDTLEEVIGISGNAGDGSLKDFGIDYKQVEQDELCHNCPFGRDMYEMYLDLGAAGADVRGGGRSHLSGAEIRLGLQDLRRYHRPDHRPGGL